MTAVLILVISEVVLLQFAIGQWRLIWIATANQPLSDSLKAATGIDGESIGSNDFGRLLGLCDELSPEIRKATPWLREVTSYYRIVAKVERVFRSLQPGVAAWAASEMETCSRYVAAVLDQNLAFDLDRRAAVRSSI